MELRFALLLAALHLPYFLQGISYPSSCTFPREIPESLLSRPPLQLGAGLELGLPQSDMPERDTQLDEKHGRRGVEESGAG